MYMIENNKNMKKISKLIIALFFASFTLVSCNGLLGVDSDGLVSVDEYPMTAANDTLYSMFGIFSQLEKLSDSYVLLGELRGDLMDVNSTSDMYLHEINNFEVTKNNPYTNNIKDYYAVINNCNYVIHNIDTSVVIKTVKVYQKVYAAAKAIRAWTYMQIALNYGTATYYDKPILTIDDAQRKDYPEYDMQQLADVLIADLEPLKEIAEPRLGSLFSYNTAYSFFPVRFLLGDLYLWKGTATGDPVYYEKAATEYHDLMLQNGYTISNHLRAMYVVLDGSTSVAFTGSTTSPIFMSFSIENITNIASTNQFGNVFKLDSLVLNKNINSSVIANKNWSKQMYFHSAVLDTVGDLRRIGSISTRKTMPWVDTTTLAANYIYKYITLNEESDDNTKPESKETAKRISIYRVPLLYLRYAEAVNRLGKPNLAFAVLKYGLNSSNIQRYVPTSERASLPNYMNFPDAQFDYVIRETNGTTTRYTNIGIRMRGCGNVNMDTTYYRIPQSISKQDSILFVEDMIEQELALETAFEGNRFHDLMRIAIRRNDNAYLADKVAAKHVNNQAAIKTILMDKTNWYLKK